MAATNLQIQLTSFIGRESDLTAIKELLTASRLVTLTGVGGSGKTRLAIQTANRSSENYPDGIWLVDFAPVRDPGLIPQVVAQTLGLRQSSNESTVDTLTGFLESKRLLLILDNCEHMREPCARLAAELLLHAPELRILATSRERLDLAGETLYPLPGLAWPELPPEIERDDREALDFRQIAAYDAIHLFVDRAKACSPKFCLTAENVRAVIDICRRLDGLPLALELASARVNILTVYEIAERISGGTNPRFALYLSGPRTGHHSRHHTLHDAIHWSFTLLSGEDQILFRRLAIFEAGFSLETVEAVCMDKTTANVQVLDGISSLVQKSLVVSDTLSRAQARYRLLETVREYALERLDEAGETAALRDRHLGFFLTRAEEAASRMGDAYQQLWLNWLDGELDNLRAALAWSLEDGQIEAGLRLASALVRFWEIRSLNREALAWFERLLARAGEDVSPVVHANACTFASFIAMFLSDAAAATRYGRKAVELAEAAGSEAAPVRAFALSGLASGARAVGDFQTAYTLIHEAAQYYREAGPIFYLGMSLLAEGDVAIELGEFDAARALLNESLRLAQEAGDIFRIAHAYNNLGDLARYERKDSQALAAYRKSEVLLRKLNTQHDLASVLCNLGRTHVRLSDLEQARLLFNEGLSIQKTEQNLPGVVECLVGLATVAIQEGLPGEGVRLIAACEAWGKQKTNGVWPAKRMGYEDYLDLAGTRLAEDQLNLQQTAGRTLSLDQAIKYAQNLPLKGIRPLDQEKNSGDLTQRELEVVGLIALGKTNGEIAQALVLSRRTVEKHAANILSKLGLASRAQVVRWAIAEGLSQVIE